MAKRSRPAHTARPVHLSLDPTQRLCSDPSFPFTISIASRIDSVSRHDHEFCEIIYIHHGSGSHEIEGRSIPLTRGQLLILPPGVRHSFPAQPRAWHKHAVIAFTPALFSGWRTAIDQQRLLDAVAHSKQYLYTVPPNLIMQIETSIETMFYENTLKSAGFTAVIRLELLKFIAYCERFISASRITLDRIDDSEPVINAALVNIEHNYMHLRTIGDILYPSKINKKYFIRLFKKTVRFTPIQYLNRLRIEKCLPSLAAKDSTVMQEAYACGFHDIAHFNRLFRRFIGMSPLAFKKRVRAGTIDIARYDRLTFRSVK